MDDRTLPAWRPDFESMTYRVRHYGEASHTDVPDEWISILVLQQCQRESKA